MQRTPSPPGRLHTPPAPLHGSKHDSYEPYSPRRSTRISRIAAQHQQQSTPARPRQARAARGSTPTPSSKTNGGARSSLQGFSPPSSPISPDHLRSPRSTRRTHFEDDLFAPQSGFPHSLSAAGSRNMLPTPAKTPRKRMLQSEESLGSTARVLFANRPANVEDAMPTPRKGRKSTRELYSLESFREQDQDVGEPIEVYTDSKERIPTEVSDEDNPFFIKKGKGKGKAKAKGTPKSRKADPKTAKMQDAVNRDEGMIYIFRGKKILRKFHDGPPSNASDAGAEFSDDEVRHGAGFEARRPLTRSSIKPRLLFQEEIKQQRREHGSDVSDAEEAVTDIEVPIATPSSRKRKAAQNGSPTPRREASPPAVRTTRQISFSSWTRVKSSAPESSSSRELRKRSGDHLESSTEKRSRSERSSPMLID